MSENTNHKILARKYRPTSFDELVGQDNIVNTISNSIQSNRLGQAYLFTGIRGVGKTTTARILARTINYTLDSAVYTPLIKIEKIGLNCQAIMESRHPDVFEMDAASNTGIDNVREIINFAQTKPTMAKFKIFIIDEVHMLSKQAFNGLLKILEEPPEHVVFIFATTEIEKIPVTVLSRCQKFNLKRIDNNIMSKYLKTISEKESISVSNESLNIICNASEGSMRDALSILDQAISLCEGNITQEKLSEMLNLNNMNFIIDLFEKLIQSQTEQIPEKISEIYQNGFEAVSIVRDLSRITHFASLMKLNIPMQNDILSDQQKKDLEKLITSSDISSLVHMWQMLLKGYNEVKSSFDQNIALEMLFIKLCYSNQLPPIDSLINDIKKTVRKDTKKIESEISAEIESQSETVSIPETFDEIKSMLVENDIRLSDEIDKFDLIEYKIGHIELSSNEKVSDEVICTMQSTLNNVTSIDWTISVSGNDVEDQNQITIDNIKEHFPNAEVVNEDENIQNGG